LEDVIGYEVGASFVVFDCGGPKLRVAAVSPKVVRVTLAPDGVFREGSYAVVRGGKSGSRWRTAGARWRSARGR